MNMKKCPESVVYLVEYTFSLFYILALFCATFFVVFLYSIQFDIQTHQG
jgi:hypothetical protein